MPNAGVAPSFSPIICVYPYYPRLIRRTKQEEVDYAANQSMNVRMMHGHIVMTGAMVNEAAPLRVIPCWDTQKAPRVDKATAHTGGGRIAFWAGEVPSTLECRIKKK